MKKKMLMCKISYECLVQRFNLSFNENDKLNNNKVYEDLKNRQRDIKIKIKHFIINCKTINTLYRLIRRII